MMSVEFSDDLFEETIRELFSRRLPRMILSAKGQELLAEECLTFIREHEQNADAWQLIDFINDALRREAPSLLVLKKEPASVYYLNEDKTVLKKLGCLQAGFVVAGITEKMLKEALNEKRSSKDMA